MRQMGKILNKNLRIVQQSKPRSDSSRQRANEANNLIKTPVTPAGLLTAQLTQIIRDHTILAIPALNLLDLYLCMWECYVIKSAEKIRLEEEQRQLQESNKWLICDNDLLRQRCNEQALVLWDRRRAIHALRDDIILVLQASDRRAHRIDRP